MKKSIRRGSVVVYLLILLLGVAAGVTGILFWKNRSVSNVPPSVSVVTTSSASQTSEKEPRTSLGELLSKNGTYTIKYLVGGGAMDFYVALPDKARRDDYVLTTRMSLYFIDGVATECAKDTEKALCRTKLGEEPVDARDLTIVGPTYKEILNNEVRDLPARTIAGVTAHCFLAEEKGQNVELCLSDEGAILFLKASVGEIVATEYKVSVDPVAFTFPVKPEISRPPQTRP